ncbi:MAG: hypothetical protein RJA47_1401, partial [Actinomycetota bacterium]
MLTAKVTQSNGRVIHVRLVQSDSATDTTVAGEEATALAAESGEAEGETHSEVKTAPNPIAPETKELAWAAGSFIVLFVLMRFFL